VGKHLQIDDILPATGVCALLGNEQVAIFRPRHDEQVFAISNIDPFFEASVLSRGLIAEHQGELWVASPLKKQRFRLSDGLCMEDESHSVKHYDARVKDGKCSWQSVTLAFQWGAYDPLWVTAGKTVFVLCDSAAILASLLPP
jgi:nitrite reductase (NADH) small subunit